MQPAFPEPTYLPCPDCGASVARAEVEAHECEEERRLDYQVFQQREEVERLPGEIVDYLASPRGRFELWYAERERRKNERR
jgi:hypothetical protein